MHWIHRSTHDAKLVRSRFRNVREVDRSFLCYRAFLFTTTIGAGCPSGNSPELWSVSMDDSNPRADPFGRARGWDTVAPVVVSRSSILSPAETSPQPDDEMMNGYR